MNYSVRSFMIKKLILFPFLMLSYALFGQQGMNQLYRDYISAKRSGADYSKKIQGSPWENDEFREARVYYKGSDRPFNVYIRYNSYENEMEFRKVKDGNIMVLENKNSFDSILTDNKVYQYLKYIEDNLVKQGYFIRLFDGECRLYKMRSKKFQEEKPPASGYDEYKPPAFITENDEYYVSFEGAPLIKIPTRKKKILELFHKYGFENKEMSKVRYKEDDLLNYFRGLKKSAF